MYWVLFFISAKLACFACVYGYCGRQAGFPLYLPPRGCVFVGGTWASVVSHCPPTKNISPGFVRVPLQSLPRRCI